MDDDPLLLSQGRKKIGPEIDPSDLPPPEVILTGMACLIWYVLWKHFQDIREVLGVILFVIWLGGMCFVRFLGIRALIRFINRIAERFVNPPGSDPDDKSESN